MRPLRSLLIYLLAVFLGGALLAPWLYWLVQTVLPDSGLAHSPFRRYEDRAFLLVALAGICPLLRSFQFTWCHEAGLTKPAGQWHRLAAGFALGFGSLAGVAALMLVFHDRTLNQAISAKELGFKLLGAGLTAGLVAVLEEILFRGAVFGALRRVWDWRLALVLSSMVYALVHFMSPADLPGPVTWSSGLELLPRKLGGFADFHALVPGFFNLTLAGILLALAFQRTGNLWFSIGLHAGWIFWLKSCNFLTAQTPQAPAWIFGTDRMIDGWLALAVLGCAVPVLLWQTAARPKAL